MKIPRTGRAPTTVLLLVALLGATVLAGCHEPLDDSEIVLAFATRDTDQNPEKDPTRLAAWIEAETGIPTRIRTVAAEAAALEALRFGHAHAAFMDGGAAWIGWKKFGFDAIAAEQNGDGRTHYFAQAWVLNASAILDFDDLRGTTSCHTGWLKSAGMIMPLGYLVANGHAEVVGDADDIASVQPTLEAFFSDPLIPEGGIYGDYRGAFRCLTEGVGDVAFVRDTTWEEHCTGGNAADWCLPRDAYRTLPAFGAVPSHPVMVGTDTSTEVRTRLADALVALNDSPEGRSILEEVLETPGITAVETEAHLGDYSSLAQHVPGLAAQTEADLGVEA